MVNELDIAQMQDVEESMMPSRATVLTGTRTRNQSGNYVFTYSPASYDEDRAVVCRIYAGASADDLVLVGDVLANSQVWTVVLPAGTIVKGDDKIWRKGKPKPYNVRAVSDGGDYESAVVAICVEPLANG